LAQPDTNKYVDPHAWAGHLHLDADLAEFHRDDTDLAEFHRDDADLAADLAEFHRDDTDLAADLAEFHRDDTQLAAGLDLHDQCRAGIMRPVQ
jgi:hypothetical protein